MQTAQLPFHATLDEYEAEARRLLETLQAKDESATLTIADARLAVAREYAFDDWDKLTAFTREVADPDDEIAQFEAAVEAMIAGDLDTLRSMLDADPELVRKRSARRHRCTLLHYIGANGVEDGRQKTPANAVELTRLLLTRGAEPDAVANLYDNECTTMSMLVSSCHPANAGLQVQLAETLLEHGAQLDGPGSKWQSAILTALTFGYRDTAEALAKRRASIDDLAEAAGLGRVEDVRRLLPSSDAQQRHIALALASQLGNAEVVRILLDAGEDPSRLNPDGFHAHATPLHHAVWNGKEDVVRLLVERGARLDIRDTIYRATPLEWAEYGKKDRIAEYLRGFSNLSRA